MTGHLISTAAVLAPCNHCGAHILACRAAGFRAYADPQPIDVNQEIAARLCNRPVYDLLTQGLPKRMYLEYRNLTRVIAGRSYPVVAEHACPSGRAPDVSVAGMDPFRPGGKKPGKEKRKVMVNRQHDEIPF